MGAKPGLINSRVKYPTLGMTLANLFGLVGFLMLNIITWLLFQIRLIFPCLLLAIDQYLYVCQNYEMKIRSLRVIISICFAVPMLVAFYDLFLQDVVLYDYMWMYIKMSPYTTVFFFFVLAPSFFAFSFICNLLVLSSIVHRQSKTARKQIGRSLNPRQLQHHKGIVYTYILQAFLPLVLATPYYIANLCFMFNVEIDLRWFIIGEAIIGTHPLTNALITLLFLRPYRRAFKRICPLFKQNAWKTRCYNSIQQDPFIIAADLADTTEANGCHSAAVSL
uniref:G protein-coupled receptor n=1 Tax=Ditylenchus dipsaci TaxID=166011 RepID=A0A915DNG2_9BILA